MFKLADLFVAISAPLGPLNTTLANVKAKLLGMANIGTTVGGGIVSGISGALAGISGKLAGLGGGLAGLSAGAMAATIAGVTAIASGLVKAGFMAASFAEDVNKAELVFGSMVGKVIAGADDMAARFGVVKSTFVNTAASLGLMLEAAGMAQKDVTDLSLKLAKLAMDAKSAFNIPMDEAVRKIEAGLAGMSRPVREWGIDLTKTHVKQKAFIMGLFNGKGEMDQHTATLVRAKILTEGLAIAQDDLEHSQGRLTQSWEGFTGRLTNFATAIGDYTSGPLALMISGLNKLYDVLSAFNDQEVANPGRALAGLFFNLDTKEATAARQAAIDARIQQTADNEKADAAMAKVMGTHVPAHRGPMGYRQFSDKIAEAAAGGKDAIQSRMLAVQQQQLVQLQQLNSKGRPTMPPKGVAMVP